MKNCLNCKKEIDLVGDFCSTKCSDDWQSMNDKCSKCGNPINLLEDKFTIINDGSQDPKMVCNNCNEEGDADFLANDTKKKNDDVPPPPMMV